MKTYLLTIVTILLGVAQTGFLGATVYPGGGKTLSGLSIGSRVQISWTNDLYSELVDVFLWDGDRQKLIRLADNIPASQREFTWTIPEDIREGKHFRFVIRDDSDSNKTDMSSGFISIGLKEASESNLDELAVITEILTSPSPVSGAVSIRWNRADMFLLELIDGFQRTVMQQPLAPGQTSTILNLQSFSSGMYFVRLYGASGNVSIEPIIVSR